MKVTHVTQALLVAALVSFTYGSTQEGVPITVL